MSQFPLPSLVHCAPGQTSWGWNCWCAGPGPFQDTVALTVTAALFSSTLKWPCRSGGGTATTPAPFGVTETLSAVNTGGPGGAAQAMGATVDRAAAAATTAPRRQAIRRPGGL